MIKYLLSLTVQLKGIYSVSQQITHTTVTILAKHTIIVIKWLGVFVYLLIFHLAETHVFNVPDVISSVTKTMHFFPLTGDSQKS